MQDPVPETFIILDSNENATTKFQALKNKLLYAQESKFLGEIHVEKSNGQ